MKQDFVFPLDITAQGTPCKDALTGCWDIGSIQNPNTFGEVHFLKVDETYSGYQILRHAGMAMCNFLDSGQKVILFAKEYLEKCGKDVVEATLLHELGHFACGHLTYEEALSYNTGTIVTVNESEADDFAIQYIGKEALKGSFLSMVTAFLGCSQEDAIERLLERDRPRFERLFS